MGATMGAGRRFFLEQHTVNDHVAAAFLGDREQVGDRRWGSLTY